MQSEIKIPMGAKKMNVMHAWRLYCMHVVHVLPVNLWIIFGKKFEFPIALSLLYAKIIKQRTKTTKLPMLQIVIIGKIPPNTDYQLMKTFICELDLKKRMFIQIH